MSEFIFKKLRVIQEKLINNTPRFKREFYKKIDWDFRVNAIIGPRGVGKTTLMLQRIIDIKEGLYFSCDDITVVDYGLLKLVYELHVEQGVNLLCIDEIHKYSNWTQEIKNISDSFPDLKVILSGSSSIDILNSTYDLSRRILVYHLNTLSFREFLLFKYNLKLPQLTLLQIFKDYKKISANYASQIKFKFFKIYLKEFAYFTRDTVQNSENYFLLLENTIKKTINEDISRIYNIRSQNLIIFEQILFFLANISPSEMTYTNISKKVKIDAKTVEYYCQILAEAGLVNIIKKYDTVTNHLLKEKKIFLSNTNLMYLYNQKYRYTDNLGMLREVFFVDCIKRTKSFISLHSKQDFNLIIDDVNYICEIGGENKKVKSKNKTYVIADNVFVGVRNIIPLWLFGCLEE
jgi:uncharacterized protein